MGSPVYSAARKEPLSKVGKELKEMVTHSF